jgi:hypothetical protein
VLADGSVLIVGGIGADGRVVGHIRPGRHPALLVERFRPTTLTTEVVADAGVASRARHTTTVLTDGRVLLVGGVDDAGQTLASAEVWNSGPRQIEAAVTLAQPRREHTAHLLGDGTVVIDGGSTALC